VKENKGLYLSERKQRVNINDNLSAEKCIAYGVPQGSILGPLIFFLFINDLQISLHGVINSTDMYADDTKLYDISLKIL